MVWTLGANGKQRDNQSGYGRQDIQGKELEADSERHGMI